MKLTQDDVAVVTGAAGGIGLALTRALLARGARVVLADVEQEALDKAAGHLDPTRTRAVPTDVTDAAAVRDLAQATLDAFGRVDLVVNNAGVGGTTGPVWELDERDWDWTIGVNLRGVVHGIRAFVPHLVAQGRGHVLNVASAAGLVAPPFLAPYAATKHAVVGLTDALAADLALIGSPVGATVACPGFVASGIHGSERNRPAHLRHDAPSMHPATPRFAAAFAAMAAQEERPADDVAPLLIEAVEAGDRYVFTDASMAAGWAARVAQVNAALARRSD